MNLERPSFAPSLAERINTIVAGLGNSAQLLYENMIGLGSGQRSEARASSHYRLMDKVLGALGFTAGGNTESASFTMSGAIPALRNIALALRGLE